MKHRFALAAALLLAAPPLLADDHGDPNGDTGRSLMERGTELFLEGLRQEMEPTLRDLRGLADEFGPSLRSFLQEMGPALADMLDDVQDWSRYEPPEMLPNGDIIIRRKPDPDPEPEPDRPQAPDTTDI